MIGANARMAHKPAPQHPRLRWLDPGGSAPLALAGGTVDLHWLRYARASGPGRALAAPVLARYLGCADHEVSIEAEAGGRPRLAHPGSALDFNLAHTAGRLLLAVGRGRLGVDAEAMATRRDHLALARHQFAEDEIALVAGAPDAERARVFLELWTAKEALAKALGRGLDALRAIGLAHAADGSLVPTRLPADAGDPAAWTLTHFEPERGYLAALATGRAT